MEAYAEVLSFAIPFFIFLIVIEAIVAARKGIKINRGADTISSLSAGIIKTVKEVLGLTVVIGSYSWIVDKVAIVELPASWLIFLVGFVGMDFAGYWSHRLNHEINFLWNRHIIHHSSDEFNLSCALRVSLSTIFSFFNLFLIPAAVFGVPEEMIAIMAPLHFFGQFWYHTRLINKMGWLENWLVTPSHHRVHHAINPEYLNKNYGNIFIFWDKWFGTFQPELQEVPPVFGAKRPVKTWNPIIISFQHLWLLIQDAWRSHSYWDKARIWLMPAGWRPADVIEKFPVAVVSDVLQHQKYDSRPSGALLSWAWFQLIVNLVLALFLFNHIAAIGFPGVFVYGAFLFVSIFSYTALLDKANYALSAEALRLIFGLGILWWLRGWFGMELIFPLSTFLMIFFLTGSLAAAGFFYFAEIRVKERRQVKVGL